MAHRFALGYLGLGNGSGRDYVPIDCHQPGPTILPQLEWRYPSLSGTLRVSRPKALTKLGLADIYVDQVPNL